MMLKQVLSLVLSVMLVTAPVMARPHSDIENIGNRKVNGLIFRMFPNFTSIEAEMRVGYQYAQYIEDNAHIEEDEGLNKYITGLTNKIAKHSDAKTPFTIKIYEMTEFKPSRCLGAICMFIRD